MVQVFSVVTGRNVSVMWEGCWDLWPIKAMEEGSGEGVSSKPMSIESFPETDLSLPAVIDDQVDGCW